MFKFTVRVMIYRDCIKPIFDFFFALSVLIISSPILLIIGVVIYTNIGFPVLFNQVRPGKEEKLFNLLKFRTMTSDTDSEGNFLPDELRLTRIGRLLRRTSLDELPQFINVLRGELSIVGPRPLLVEYLSLYNQEQKRRHTVKPGITGWAQVNGRNAITWEQKFKFDLYYVENISFKLDLIILFRTALHVLSGSGVVNQGGVTMEKFRGTFNE